MRVPDVLRQLSETEVEALRQRCASKGRSLTVQEAQFYLDATNGNLNEALAMAEGTVPLAGGFASSSAYPTSTPTAYPVYPTAAALDSYAPYPTAPLQVATGKPVQASLQVAQPTPAPASIPAAHGFTGHVRRLIGAEGAYLGMGDRVQTEWTRAEGGDGRYYAGTITAVHLSRNEATVRYDDGDTWTGDAMDVYPYVFGRTRPPSSAYPGGGGGPSYQYHPPGGVSSHSPPTCCNVISGCLMSRSTATCMVSMSFILLTISTLIRYESPGDLPIFFRVDTCRGGGFGGQREVQSGPYSLRPPSAASGDACPIAGKPSTEPAIIQIEQLDGVIPSVHYRPVLLLAAGAYAELTFSVTTQQGTPLLPRTVAELGPNDSFPWLNSVSAPPALAAYSRSPPPSPPPSPISTTAPTTYNDEGTPQHSPASRRLLKGAHGTYASSHTLSPTGSHGYSGVGNGRWGQARTRVVHRRGGGGGCTSPGQPCRSSFASSAHYPSYDYGARAMPRSSTILVVHRRHYFYCYTCLHGPHYYDDRGQRCYSHAQCKAAETYSLLADHDRYELALPIPMPLPISPFQSHTSDFHSPNDLISPWPIKVIIHQLTMYGAPMTFAADGGAASDVAGGTVGAEDADKRALPIYVTMTTDEFSTAQTVSRRILLVALLFLIVFSYVLMSRAD